jgi:hypothetical protein
MYDTFDDVFTSTCRISRYLDIISYSFLPACYIVFDSISRLVFGEEYRLRARHYVIFSVLVLLSLSLSLFCLS